jgi:hypothetical protein
MPYGLDGEKFLDRLPESKYIREAAIILSGLIAAFIYLLILSCYLICTQPTILPLNIYKTEKNKRLLM